MNRTLPLLALLICLTAGGCQYHRVTREYAEHDRFDFVAIAVLQDTNIEQARFKSPIGHELEIGKMTRNEKGSQAVEAAAAGIIRGLFGF